MRAVLDIIMVALNLYTWIVIAGAILSWLIAFGVVNIRNDVGACDLESVSRADRTVPAADPQFSAQHRGRRHFADHPPARRHAARADHRLLRLSQRLLKPP